MATEHKHADSPAPESPAPKGPVSRGQALRYATDQLYSLRPQPPKVFIDQILNELSAALHPLHEVPDPPKNLDEAIAHINAELDKVEPKLKKKPDLSEIQKAADAWEKSQSKPAEAPAEAKKAS